MTDEELIEKLKSGMRMTRSSLRSRWYGVIGNLRHTGNPLQITRLVKSGKLRFTGPRQIEVKVND